MHPTTPVNISRSRLKQLATWIRDDLDILVAREGPDILRSDDVLFLHEIFVNLRQADTITALDLRATGIHKAVQDIAGVATRWPSRLCDDCDKIVSIWQAKFGSFRDLHPLLYGRGGRLEGIANVTEHSREVDTVPTGLLSHVLILTCRPSSTGGLGLALIKSIPDGHTDSLTWAFVLERKYQTSNPASMLIANASRWWINPYFAYHAGIIGLESVEGGTTYDKYGAYALVLKDTGEVEASSMDRFTYRCSRNDKGRYQLTSANPRSRGPVRVLRSHSVNSMWGPKAGIRYEGL